jgi:hypothetical protein
MELFAFHVHLPTLRPKRRLLIKLLKCTREAKHVRFHTHREIYRHCNRGLHPPLPCKA